MMSCAQIRVILNHTEIIDELMTENDNLKEENARAAQLLISVSEKCGWTFGDRLTIDVDKWLGSYKSRTDKKSDGEE